MSNAPWWRGTRGEWYVGRPVMVTRNDPALGVFNGDIGLTLPPATPGGALRVWFLDGDQLRSVGVSRLAHVETAFAMTVHKSQGSEFAEVLLVLPELPSPLLTRSLLYTGITRAKARVELWGLAARLQEAVSTRAERAAGLAERLAIRATPPDEPPPAPASDAAGQFQLF